MRVETKPSIPFFLVLVFSFLATSSPSFGQGAIRSSHGDWDVRCDRQPGSQTEQCVAMQFAKSASVADAGLTIVIIKNSNLFRMLLPLGILLKTEGGDAKLSIDGKGIGGTDAIRCLPNGCVTEQKLDANLLQKLKAGSELVVSVQKTSNDRVQIPISLSGFTAAHSALP